MREFKIECIYEGLSYIRVLIVSLLFDHFWKVTIIGRYFTYDYYMKYLPDYRPLFGKLGCAPCLETSFPGLFLLIF